MVVVVYLTGVLLFVIVFSRTRLATSFGEVSKVANAAIAVFKDPQLDDDAKERMARQASLSLFRKAFDIVLKAALTLASAIAPFWAADALNLAPWQETIAFASRWDVLIVTTVVMIGAWLAWRRTRKKAH